MKDNSEYFKIESNVITKPSIQIVTKIAKVLGAKAEELMK